MSERFFFSSTWMSKFSWEIPGGEETADNTPCRSDFTRKKAQSGLMTYWGETRTERNIQWLKREAILGHRVLLFRATQPDCTEQGWQHTVLYNTKKKECKKRDKAARRRSVFETCDDISFQLYECLKQGCKQWQWASSLPSKKPSRLTLAPQKLSEDDRRATLSLFLLTEAESPSKGSTLLAICCHSVLGSVGHFVYMYTITRLQWIIRLSSQTILVDVLTILNVNLNRIYRSKTSNQNTSWESSAELAVNMFGFSSPLICVIRGSYFQFVIKDSSYIHPSIQKSLCTSIQNRIQQKQTGKTYSFRNSLNFVGWLNFD